MIISIYGDPHSYVIDPLAGTLITNILRGGKPEYAASAGVMHLLPGAVIPDDSS